MLDDPGCSDGVHVAPRIILYLTFLNELKIPVDCCRRNIIEGDQKGVSHCTTARDKKR